MRTLVAVMTCHKRRSRAMAQRDTWVPALRAQGVDVRFFLGAPPSGQAQYSVMHDEVWLHDVRDDYAGIPEKVRRICGWTVANGYDRVSKVDDDVYIAPRRYAVLPGGEHDYVGRFRGPHGNYPAHFASGFFYSLSERAAMFVASTPWNGDWMDERFVANTLAYNRMYGYNDPVNYLVTGPQIQAREVLHREIIRSGTVFCEYGPLHIHEMHAELADAPPVPNHPGLRQVIKVPINQQQLFASPTDRIPEHKLERR